MDQTLRTRLIWLDLEMTGLDPANDSILEIATVVTDSALNELAEGPVLAIHQPDAVLAAMDDWNTSQHGKSGLTERVRKSQVDAAAAERATLEFLSAWVPPGKSPMCGNSICQDRRFLFRLMPELERFFAVSLAKDGLDRYADGGAMLDALLALPPDSFIPADGPQSAPRRAMSRAPTAIAPAPPVPRFDRATPEKPNRNLAIVLAAALLGAAEAALRFEDRGESRHHQDLRRHAGARRESQATALSRDARVENGKLRYVHTLTHLLQANFQGGGG